MFLSVCLRTILAAALAVVDPLIVNCQALDKPALTPNLDYLEQGSLCSLSPTQSTWTKLGAGSTPEDCKTIANNHKKNPGDLEIYSVHYTDSDDAWVFCRYEDTPFGLASTVDIFGLPVAMRSGENMDVVIHETGHSLDILGAYGERLSGTKLFIIVMDADPNVPDNYARTNQAENVAQNTVVGVYDKVVAGGFPSAQPNWHNIFHRYSTLQRRAGNQILPGGQCNRHLTISTSKAAATANGAKRPDTSFRGNYTNIMTDYPEFSTKESCAF
ncbi:hypothetical protein TSTA_086250 [Talaromyces stipitatus ATCC 10500]|uniref:Conidiation-specific protein (Con-13) n=1 Tax=Talaromyces stipitatus (strain ATCC 10500 / CBS 375.48 / QM 6759 / NRRL 1006) TaxID=441959 RepID=B8M216_TALSN|nr:uncharacterized protein TSTA_086250 [Talaromyces stipitatus ATCC 10500]EED21394.1 hypothetical protein TSTA_086250 [Talaromyces stipitatus ATCC 10500]